MVLIAAGTWYFRSRSSEKAAALPIARTARIQAGTIQRVVRLTGTTSAGRYANIAAPLLRGPESGRALTLIFLAKSGTWVKRGEKVAEIDGQAAKDHIDDTDATVQTAEADIRKRKAEQAISSESLRQALTQAKARLDKAKLDYAAAEIRTTIDQELLKLSVEQYEAEYKEQLADIKTNEIAQRSELRILELTRDRHVRHRDRHIHDLKRFTITTPMEGLAVMQTIFRSGEMAQIQVGDQVYPNQPFMKIVDPASMQVDASINQVESELIRIGQPATVYFDAFPGLKLKGRVFSIGALAVGGWRQNYYIRAVPVKIQLVEQESRVIPDLSAGADVVVAQKDNAVLMPLAALQTDAGKTVVFVKAGEGWVEREVKLGIRSNTDAEVLEGLKPGEEVALQRPAMPRQATAPGK
ncbi:MAG: efflux RND transporter periplasmic adaptor subunit [Bryobacteraceae bacterium]